MKYYIVILANLLLPFVAMGQDSSSKERPAWVNGYFIERNNSYIEVVSAVGYSEDNARDKAAQIIVERRSLATGQRAHISISDGNIHVDGSNALTVKARIIDQYTERLGAGEYRVSLLVQTAKNPEYEYESVSVTRRYDFSPRVFVPGAAQFHKGQKARGALFITGEVVLIGGAVASAILYKDTEKRLLQENNLAPLTDISNYVWGCDPGEYADNMKMYRTIRNACIIGAAALYVWNVIDGVASKGKPHIVIGESSSINFMPYVDHRSSGLMLSLNF